MNLILNKSQARAVYTAMCNLNEVNAKIRAAFGEVSVEGINVFQDYDDVVNVARVARYAVVEAEHYRSQAAFATAYGLDEPMDRAQMVIDGTHPWITYDGLLDEFGLDDSFVWTAATLSPYVEQRLKNNGGAAA